MAYVYRHIRLDKNAPFYIGIGGDASYDRAKTEIGRNDYWKNIVALSEWDWEILVDNISWEDACLKEKEFISIYKRSKDGGTLSNLTLGGEGQCGMTPWNFGKETSQETKKKQSLKKIGKPPPNKGKPMPKHQLENLIKVNRNRVHPKGIVRTEEWRKNISTSRLGKMVGEEHHAFGKPMKPHVLAALKEANKNRPAWNKGVKMTEEQRVKNKYNQKSKGVLQLDINGNLVKEHFSLLDAANFVNCSKQNIYEAIYNKDNKGGRKTAKGFWWEYKETQKPQDESGGIVNKDFSLQITKNQAFARVAICAGDKFE